MSEEVGLRLAGAGLLAEGETTRFSLRYLGREREGFVVKYRGELFAYLNECPHWAVDLDLGDGHFFDPELQHIYCKNHGALFHPLDGRCVTGPCLGRSLVSFPLERDGDDAVVLLPGERP